MENAGTVAGHPVDKTGSLGYIGVYLSVTLIRAKQQ